MKKSFLLLSLFLYFSPFLFAQISQPLPRSTPEKEGVQSAAILTFLDSVAASRHELHSFMMLRHGKVIAEGWWSPYQPQLKHTLYSLSKSFTATAVGFAQAEKKLALSDKVISFFPTQLPDSISPHLAQLTVKDLLTMSVGQEPDPTGIVNKDSNWVRRFLALPIAHQPGSTFLYNSMATYMLSAIVQRVTGQPIITYLQPRLFEPLGISDMDWETDPKGINTGGWGLRVKTEDIAKFAQLFLQKGVWKGKQILPTGWVEEASSAHIIQHPDLPLEKRAQSDWEQGYGYQMWRCRNNGYRGDGAFGQYAIVLPAQDAVIAITSETADMQGEMNLIWNILLPAMKAQPLPADEATSQRLQQRLAALALPPPVAQASASIVNTIDEKQYRMAPNSMGIQNLSFDFSNNQLMWTVQTDTATYNLPFTAGAWQPGETNMRGPYLVSANNTLKGLTPFKTAGSYTWLTDSTLQLTLRYIESPHTETVLCAFDGQKLGATFKRSFNTTAPEAAVTVEGRLVGE